MERLIFGKTYDEIFEKAFKNMTRGMEDHEFKHYNNALGCHIYSKEHYKHVMKKRGMLPTELCHTLAEEWDRKNPNQEFDELTPKAREIIESIRLTADQHGNIQLGGRAIKALKEIGAIADSEHRPDALEGGFS